MMAPIPTPGTAAAQSPVRRGPCLGMERVLLWGWERTPHI